MKIKAGIIQMDVTLGNVKANLDAAIESIEELASQKADLAVLPEMWSSGFDNENLAIHVKETPGMLEKLSQIATQHHIMIAGSMAEAAAHGIYNTLYLIDKQGSVAGSYRKVHLFRLTQEEKYFQAGNQAVVCETSIGSLGLMICYDVRFPELCRSLAIKGANLVIVSAQWPLSRIDRWDTLLRARAIENQLFIVAVNRCGIENGLEFGGHSQIISPFGNVMLSADTQVCTNCAELDFQELDACRKEISCLEERMPQAYEY